MQGDEYSNYHVGGQVWGNMSADGVPYVRIRAWCDGCGGGTRDTGYLPWSAVINFGRTDLAVGGDYLGIGGGNYCGVQWPMN